MSQELKRIALDGDTAAEVGFSGPKSTGGDSALHYIAHGTTPALEALQANLRAFPR